MKNLKHYFLGGLIFSGTVIISFIGFAAYTNLPTQNTGDVMTSTIWNNLINKVNTIGTQVDGLSNIPTGAIMSFYLSSCPSGWIIANGTNGTPDLRGQFIRANVTSNTYDPDYATRVGGLGDANKVGSTQGNQIQSHNHGLSSVRLNASAGASIGAANVGGGWGFTDLAGGLETRPRNIALLFCMKQ